MAMNNSWLQQIKPIQLYIILILSIIYFLIQLVYCNLSHALTLLIHSYHMLCNIMALIGCIITIKYSNKAKKIQLHESSTSSLATPSSPDKVTTNTIVEPTQHTINQQQNETSLRNTFGWTRIDILTMLIVRMCLASFCFSLLIEVIQTFIHIGHQDAIHYEISVLILGLMGLLLNGLCYLLIGGYTFHHDNSLHITSEGDVILDRVITSSGIGPVRLSNKKHFGVMSIEYSRENVREILRDICSPIFVVICTMLVYFIENGNITKFIDPFVAMISSILLLVLSYPYLKESCLILLQTIPEKFNIEQFKLNLLRSFPAIENVHEFHIWELTRRKYVSTVHIVFQNSEVYTNTMESIKKYFHSQGITIVTIQPEFRSLTIANKHKIGLECLMGCLESCNSKKCCKTPNLQCIHKGVTKSSLEKIEIQTDQQTEQQSKVITISQIKNDKENLNEETAVDTKVKTNIDDIKYKHSDLEQLSSSHSGGSDSQLNEN